MHHVIIMIMIIMHDDHFDCERCSYVTVTVFSVASRARATELCCVESKKPTHGESERDLYQRFV
jgi:hypothetical protein